MFRRMFWGIFKRQCRVALSGNGDVVGGVLFFLAVTAFFPLTLGGSPEILSKIGAGALWIAALLACLLGIGGLFQADAEDGTLDQYRLLPLGMEGVVAAKILAHWLVVCGPLVALSPVMASMLYLPGAAWVLCGVMALGTLTMTALGAFGAALLVGVPRGGALLMLLVMPLTVPVMIFGASALQASPEVTPPVLFLVGVACMALPISIIASAALLRQYE